MGPRASSRLPLPVQDVLLAAFVTVMQVQGTLVRGPQGAERPLDDLGHLGYALLVLGGAVVVARRRWPVAVLVLAGTASLAHYALGFPDGPTWLGVAVALYSVAAYGDGRRSLVVAGAAVAVLATGWLVAAADVQPRAALGWVLFRIGTSAMAVTLGESVRSRRALAAEAQERADLAERTREEEARTRVDAERLRIARDVHDTVAHAISVINVQAGVTAHVLDRRPDAAREALATIERTSAQALREMRAVLGVLRGEDDERAPHPGLAQLGALAAQARAAGLVVAVDACPPGTALPGPVDAAAYRIVQEALTNVVRHVGPTHVTVALDRGPDALEIRVVDAGPAPSAGGAADAAAAPSTAGPTTTSTTTAATTAAAPPGAGRGLRGMRERCGLLGGELRAGAVPGGGFEVRARLPLPAGEGR